MDPVESAWGPRSKALENNEQDTGHQRGPLRRLPNADASSTQEAKESRYQHDTESEVDAEVRSLKPSFKDLSEPEPRSKKRVVESSIEKPTELDSRNPGKDFPNQQVRRRRRGHIVADSAILARTVTGAPDRIDDGTRVTQDQDSIKGSVGKLKYPRSCYVCKCRYRMVDSFYHALCPSCATFNRHKRSARVNLQNRRALITGGRAKIGMLVALKLLRDGAHTTITTRFPKDAARRFGSFPDSEEWIHRLRIIGVDLRDPKQIIMLADAVSDAGPLDILVNNAAQTIRRPPSAYSALINGEQTPLSLEKPPEVLVVGDPRFPHPSALKGDYELIDCMNNSIAELGMAATVGELAQGQVIVDAGGLIVDDGDTNSWTQRVHEIDPIELLEVQLCNVTAPFILVSRLRIKMAQASARFRYIVNVTAMEGQFSRDYKGPNHPHTNMAKAALNMLTRTSAEDLRREGILMTSVDTGWITDERPYPMKIRLAKEGFHTPLDLVDGAARVYDPIVRGEMGEEVYGCLLKDYVRSSW